MATARPFARAGLRSRAMLLAMLLVCTLALATMLAYEAHDAARSHRATAERVLNDYAAVAAWDLVAGVNDELQSSVGNVLAPVTRMRATTPYELLPAPNVLATNAIPPRCPDSTRDSSHFFFRVDFRDQSLAIDGGTVVSPAMRKWLVDTIVSHGRGIYQPDWTYALLVGGPPGEARSTLAYAIRYAEHRAPIAAYGIRTCADFGAAVVSDVVTHRALLPVAVTGGVSSDSIVSVLVRGASGDRVFESARPQASPYSAEAPLDQAGALRVRATIRPRAIELLALGAIPQSRVPILVGLLTLTAAMIAVTVLQLKREHEISRLRSDFISSVSHELRTPLSQILLFAETLSLGRVRTVEERDVATGVIVQEGRRLMHLVENILHFSRAERQMTRLGLEPLDLNQALLEIVADWGPLASASDVTVETDLAPDVHAVADRSALRQMLLNLLDNALKYGPPGQRVTVGSSTADGRARFWVDDEGAGIPPRERDRVWQSFYRLERHANSSIAGSGIGLYVVRELARLHGGDAWIETATNAAHGARIVVELNAAPRAAGFTDEFIAVTRAQIEQIPTKV